MKFTYSSGQRPLDGFTLKRGIGAGGFGEVYYALSDGGMEVALKVVRGQQDVELRGIAQCLNLKHPHLVSLYDLKTDPQGEHWVVMEYVAGETLGTVLNRHPSGLPADLAQQWFLALARAVAYLHDHGIVHRDLKPGNIFIESGVLKVGDYGLSKFISSSQRTAQTQSVGTVYYMAPEISTGNYNKQIDIYAAGIILYEMLTGRVPFEGESAGEILMKHLTAPPDLSKVPPQYVPVVAKALAKNPAQRYANIGEMARAVENLGPAVKVETVNIRPIMPVVPVAPQEVPIRMEDIPSVIPVPPPLASWRARLAELSSSLAMAAVLSGLLAVLYAALAPGQKWSDITAVMFLTIAVCWGVLVPAKMWTSATGDSWTRRIVMMMVGAGVGMMGLWLNGWTPEAYPMEWERISYMFGREVRPQDHFSLAAKFVSYFAVGLTVLRWWRMADRNRASRFSCFPVIAAGFWAMVLYPFLWPGNTPDGAIALVTAAVIIQWVSPWEQPPPKAARRLRLRYA